jgi:hypothetical protein
MEIFQIPLIVVIGAEQVISILALQALTVTIQQAHMLGLLSVMAPIITIMAMMDI